MPSRGGLIAIYGRIALSQRRKARQDKDVATLIQNLYEPGVLARVLMAIMSNS